MSSALHKENPSRPPIGVLLGEGNAAPLLRRNVEAFLFDLVSSWPGGIRDKEFDALAGLAVLGTLLQALLSDDALDDLPGSSSALVRMAKAARPFARGSRKCPDEPPSVPEALHALTEVTEALEAQMLDTAALPKEFEQLLESQVAPLVRRIALLRLVLFDEPPADVSGAGAVAALLESGADSARMTLAKQWLQEWMGGDGTKDGWALPRLVPLRKFHLVPLAPAFHDLFQVMSSARCKNCNTVPKQPAICLLCGELVCTASSCCMARTADRKGAGECFLHARQCAAGFGVYLLVLSSVVLVLMGERRTFWPSPYLDQHGEEDIKLRRGKPLYLSPARYRSLVELVLNPEKIAFQARDGRQY